MVQAILQATWCMHSYLVIPFALDVIITFILSRMKVEEANEKLRAAV